MRHLIAGSFAVVVAGCAQAPESIQPSYVSQSNYINWSCPQLAEERGHLSAALATASAQQQSARTGDTVGVILLGLPVSSMSGESIAPEVARLKGEQEAVRKVMIRKHC